MPPSPHSPPGHVAWYAIEDADITSSAGAPVRVPAGRYEVERRSQVYRVRLGGRLVDVTLREFERLVQGGRIRPAERSAPIRRPADVVGSFRSGLTGLTGH